MKITWVYSCVIYSKPFENAVLQEYMQFFVFTEMRLDSAFRKLCSKLYFKAEAQQIDRILESFANRYWDCNPECLFGSAGKTIEAICALALGIEETDMLLCYH